MEKGRLGVGVFGGAAESAAAPRVVSVFMFV